MAYGINDLKQATLGWVYSVISNFDSEFIIYGTSAPCECSLGICCSDGCNYDVIGTSCGQFAECDGLGNCDSVCPTYQEFVTYSSNWVNGLSSDTFQQFIIHSRRA